MSKIKMDFKFKDWYTIKHALEKQIKLKEEYIKKCKELKFNNNLYDLFEKDVIQEKKID